MSFVYFLQSTPYRHKRYVGLTDDVDARLKKHNSGSVRSTSGYRPWKVVLVLRFEDKDKAVQFERYLKSASGRAFAKRHFW